MRDCCLMSSEQVFSYIRLEQLQLDPDGDQNNTIYNTPGDHNKPLHHGGGSKNL